jgi:hypothetical protein
MKSSGSNLRYKWESWNFSKRVSVCGVGAPVRCGKRFTDLLFPICKSAAQGSIVPIVLNEMRPETDYQTSWVGSEARTWKHYRNSWLCIPQNIIYYFATDSKHDAEVTSSCEHYLDPSSSTKGGLSDYQLLKGLFHGVNYDWTWGIHAKF